MDNQHRQIKGYRELSEADIALMNKIKEFGPLLEEVIAEVNSHVQSQRAHAKDDGAPDNTVAQARLDRAQPERWASIARTHFQEGLMALTRAVAQPTFF